MSCLSRISHTTRGLTVSQPLAPVPGQVVDDDCTPSLKNAASILVVTQISCHCTMMHRRVFRRSQFMQLLVLHEVEKVLWYYKSTHLCVFVRVFSSCWRCCRDAVRQYLISCLPRLQGLSKQLMSNQYPWKHGTPQNRGALDNKNSVLLKCGAGIRTVWLFR